MKTISSLIVATEDRHVTLHIRTVIGILHSIMVYLPRLLAHLFALWNQLLQSIFAPIRIQLLK